MENYSNEWNVHWSKVVIHWINSIFEEQCVTGLTSVTKSDILPTLIKNIFESDQKGLPLFQTNEEIAQKFIDEYFYGTQLLIKPIDLNNEENCLILFSLIIYISCIRVQIKEIMKKNSKAIDNPTQVILKQFFEEMMRIQDGEFTRKKIKKAIRSSLGSSCAGKRTSLSTPPKVSSGTLREFYDSPVLQDLKNKDSEIKRLKLILDDEAAEKNDILERISELEKKIKKKESLLTEKKKENRLLKEELERLSSTIIQDKRTEDEDKRTKDKEIILTKENIELKKEIDDINTYTDSMQKDMEKITKQNTDLSIKITNLESCLSDYEAQYEELNFKHLSLELEHTRYKSNIEEKQILIKQLKEQLEANTPEKQNLSISIDESNLGKTVIELQLVEKQEELNELLLDVDSKIQTIQQLTKDNDDLKKTHESRVSDLKSKLFDEAENDLLNLRKQLEAYVAELPQKNIELKNKHENDIRTLQTKLCEAEYTIQTKTETHITEIKELMQTNEDFRSRLETEVSNLRSKLFDAEKSHKISKELLNDHVVKLKNESKELKNKHEDLRSKLLEAENSFLDYKNTQEASIVDLKNDNEHLRNIHESAVLELSSKLLSAEKTLQSTREIHKQEIIEFRNELVDLQEKYHTDVSDYSSKLQVAENTVVINKEKHNSQIAEITKKIEDLVEEQESVVSGLNLKLLEADNSLNSYKMIQERYIFDLTKENEELLKKHETVVSELRSKILEAENEVHTIKESQEEHIIKLTKENEALLNKHETVVSELRSKILETENILMSTKESHESHILELQNRLHAASFDQQFPEAYDKLYHDFHSLTDDYEVLKGEHRSLSESHQNVRKEYDLKLIKLKHMMKEACTNAISQTEEKFRKEIVGLKQSIQANQEHINQLSSQLCDTSNKLITTKKENEDLKKCLADYRNVQSQQSLCSLKNRTRSLETVGSPSPVKFYQSKETYRTSSKTVPSGMGRVFPSVDQAEEVFNNECLADLKAGRCEVPNDPTRLSTLMYRNSLCPPHLKSSYPAETQFLPVHASTEDEIKGSVVDSDTISLLSEKNQRKRRLQTSYKKPGPPTPSKLGCRALPQSVDSRSTENASRSAPSEILNDVEKA